MKNFLTRQLIIGFLLGLIGVPAILLLGMLLTFQMILAGYVLIYLKVLAVIYLAAIVAIFIYNRRHRNSFEYKEKNSNHLKSFVPGFTYGLSTFVGLVLCFAIWSVF